jgi:hypothetical protein
VTDSDSSQTSVEIDLTVENLPNALHELLARWQELVQAEWSADRRLPTRHLVRLHDLVHAGAVATSLEDEFLFQKMGNAAKAYFNDPRVTGGSRQDASWFHTRARAVEALVDQIEAHAAKAQGDGRLSLDDVQDVARELVDIVVTNLSRIDLALEVLPELPADFADAARRSEAINGAVRSIASKLGSGDGVASIAVFESIMRGLGHRNPTNLTSLARKSRESK